MDRNKVLADALTYASSTKVCICRSGALKQLPEVLQKLHPGASVIPVADDHTWEAAGRAMTDLLRSRGITVHEPYLFPGSPVLAADYGHTGELAAYFRRFPGALPAAAGSGTINDLVKLSAYLADRPYAVLAAAASVDGYASDGAALLKGGSKITIPCPAPEIIIGDTDIMGRAPAELRAAGYADLASKIPAGADWIFADRTGEDPIHPAGWSLVQQHLRHWLSDPEDTEGLFIGLTLAGIAMQHMRSSRPVSGAEHLISHIWEMRRHTFQGAPIPHGIKVGIGILIITAAMEWLLETDPRQGKSSTTQGMEYKSRMLADEFSRIEGYEQLRSTMEMKHRSPRRREERRQALLQQWPELCRDIRDQLTPYGDLWEMMKTAGCPVRSEDIGIPKEEALETMRTAQLIRHRYTVLDVLDDLELMDQCIEALSSDPAVLT